MNIFILTTGRTGSTGFIEACKHINNYTASHESRCSELGKERLNFPDQHIEADNRLVWHLGRLEQQFGKKAIYVHLVRDTEKVAQSYLKRWNRETSIVRAYAYGILKMQEHHIKDPLEICRDLVDVVNTNVFEFLSDKPHKTTIRLENIEDGFKGFWKLIKAEGDLGAALNEFSVQHNDTASGKKANRPLEKTLRVIKKLPYFIKNA